MSTIPHDYRAPPHSDEAERSILAALMRNNDGWFDAADVVGSADFYRPQHAAIFDAMRRLVARDEPLDVVTVSGDLQSRRLLERAGGRDTIAQLADSTETAGNVVAHARIVRDCALQRRLFAAGREISRQALSPEGRTAADLLDDAERKIVAVAEAAGRRTADAHDLPPLLDKAMEHLREVQDSPGGVTGLTTGYSDLDDVTAGLQPGNLVVVAGRPAMGKTSFAMNVVERAILDRVATVVFSMEMDALMLTLRLLGSVARINLQRIMGGQLTEHDWTALAEADAKLREAPLHIDAAGTLTPSQVRSRAKRFARTHDGLGLIVVDYLQLMHTAERSETRAAEVAQITRGLKALAVDMRCPVIALAQLNRSVEARANKRPSMADLRESGAIEQDADRADSSSLRISAGTTG